MPLPTMNSVAAVISHSGFWTSFFDILCYTSIFFFDIFCFHSILIFICSYSLILVDMKTQSLLFVGQRAESSGRQTSGDGYESEGVR